MNNLYILSKVDVFKQPVTDVGKKSKKGRLSLQISEKGIYETVEEGAGDPNKVWIVRMEIDSL